MYNCVSMICAVKALRLQSYPQEGLYGQIKLGEDYRNAHAPNDLGHTHHILGMYNCVNMICAVNALRSQSYPQEGFY